MMNDIQSFFDQQTGFRKRTTYDSVLRRLQVKNSDEYKKITPYNENEIINEYDPPIFACKFAPNKGQHHILALANEDGRLAIHNTKGTRSDRFVAQAHHNAIFDLAWMFGHMKLVTVSGDHSARLFNVSNSEVVEEHIFNGHTRSVKTVAFHARDPGVFATGARDGAILIWDTRSSLHSGVICEPDSVISYSHSGSNTPHSKSHQKKNKVNNRYFNVSGANSVTGLVFQSDMTLISCGAGDGVIKAWDLRKNYKTYKREPLPKYTIPYSGSTQRNGYSHLLLDSSTLKLYANCLDNNIYCYNVSSFCAEPVMKYSSHQNSTFYIKSSLSSDGRYLLSGSSDQNAYIWNVNDSRPLLYLSGHRAEVTCVAWCQTNDVLVTCSDDMRHLFWRIGEETLPDDWDIIGCGRAVESVKNTSAQTPRSLKHALREDYTPCSTRKQRRVCEKCAMRTPGSTPAAFQTCACAVVRSTENKTFSSRKRLTDHMPCESNDSKRARRLFSPIIINQNYPSTSAASCIERADADDADLAVSLDAAAAQMFDSPTSNLPNFVIDGEAPHLNYSPEKRLDKDWLTKMRTERRLIATMQELASPSPAKLQRLDASYTPKTPHRTPTSSSTSSSKRNTRSHHSKVKRSQSPLIQFFRVTNSSILRCDQQCSSSNSNANLNNSNADQLHSK